MQGTEFQKGEAERACILTFLDFIVLSSITLFLQAKILFAFSHISPFPLPFSLSLHPPPFGPFKVDSDRSLLLIDDCKTNINSPLPTNISISLFSIHIGENKEN